MKPFNVDRIATLAFAAVLLSVVAILVVPLPPEVLDALLALNILFSGVVLLTSVTVREPLEFAAFAPALLIATLFRLSLDVSATRLILSNGQDEGGVGRVIPAFGEFVVHGNLVVGLIVFVILITIQYIVIASGSQRVAEVAARFTLDAMPGKQMALDAELNAGAIDRETMRAKRKTIQKEADFYGAMDGAGKFIKGDAIAALVIVALNLIGGIAVGVIYHGMSPSDALNTYALLTIGNALVTTLPSFLLSTSMGLMVTRVTADGTLGADLARQMLERPEVLRTVGIFSLLLALVPAFPQALFFLFGLLVLFGAWLAKRRNDSREADAKSLKSAKAKIAERDPDSAIRLVYLDPIAVELGKNLTIAMMSYHNVETLLDRANDARRELAKETGIVIPGINFRDALSMDPNSYAIYVRDDFAGGGTLDAERILAVGNESTLAVLNGAETVDPVYRFPAKWIEDHDSERARDSGAMTFDCVSILASHIIDIARTHLCEIFDRQQFARMVDHLTSRMPALTKSIGAPDGVPSATLHKAYLHLLRERVWPRDAVSTLQAMLDAAEISHDPREIAEQARRVLVPALLKRRNLRVLEGLVLDPVFEAAIVDGLSAPGAFPLDPRTAAFLRDRVDAFAQKVPAGTARFFTTGALRRSLADLFVRFSLDVSVFSYNEIPPEIEIRPVDVVEAPA